MVCLRGLAAKIALMDLRKWQQIDVMKSALASKTIAVVGLSSNPARDSHMVSNYMQQHGYTIIPVNPRESEILGNPCYPSLQDVPIPIEVVNVFREPNAVPDVARQAAEINARFMWLQLGVISVEGVKIAEASGVTCIVDRCIKVEHAKIGL